MLADPGHAWKYGVERPRRRAQRDTLLEAGKDTALAMYDRDVAHARGGAIGRRSAISTASRRPASRALGRAISASTCSSIDATRALDLPVLYRNAEFVIYDLR